MVFILIGCFAFLFLYIFDINKIYSFYRLINAAFAVGVMLIAAATIGICLSDVPSLILPWQGRLVFAVFSFCSFVLLIYSLFFALPFQDTYLAGEKGAAVVDRGVYALCRHPGVIWFFLFYLFLWLATGIKTMLWAGSIWTVMDIIHVYIQDRWLFPKTLQGYESYKKKVPFLIPDLASAKRCIVTLQ